MIQQSVKLPGRAPVKPSIPKSVSMRVRPIVHALTPPIFLKAYQKILQKRITLRGTYKTWQEARQHSAGYDADAILERVKDAARKVRAGSAVCDRDSILFDTPLYPFPLIATLLRAALESDGRLTVLDFGGALASSYYQCRDFLGGVRSLRWCVVEQPKFVACGKQEFQTDVVRFYENIESCLKEETPTVILLSGVLQYLPAPLEILVEVSRIGAPFVIIDRTPVVLSGQQAISVQHIPSTIVRSSYPIWLFNEEQLKAPLQGLYDEIAPFATVDENIGEGKLKVRYTGIIFQRRSSSTSAI
jgi:putative methyltransferase (TIGR04325 family)